jgi:hypothetical protein
MVKLVAGIDEPILEVHDRVLSWSSLFLKNAVKLEWIDSRPGLQTPDRTDHPLDDVKLYVHWLYAGDLP